ncbi:MAG: class I SAM-dependent methyltransferase [Dysgonamonadaceae bacterium]|jgi:SAM-dependent methyltransferase|nr:class I SAM-dependent methyltransferase [Dysgonamonadaceae bacterium]
MDAILQKLDIEKIRQFYNDVPEIWNKDDYWHLYSKCQIEKCLKKHLFNENEYILNAGSGGNDYGLKCNLHHVDIAQNKIEHFDKYTVASVENLPFSNNLFNGVICVGSVVNYCDAVATISELSRVLKSSGTLILEFENSWGFEYRQKSVYRTAANITSVIFQNQLHIQWLYSYKYIQNLIKQYNLQITHIYRFHLLSALMLSMGYDERTATQYTKYDKLLQYIPFINNHSNNMVLICRKL